VASPITPECNNLEHSYQHSETCSWQIVSENKDGAGSGNCTQVEQLCRLSRKLLRQTGLSKPNLAFFSFKDVGKTGSCSYRQVVLRILSPVIAMSSILLIEASKREKKTERSGFIEMNYIQAKRVSQDRLSRQVSSFANNSVLNEVLDKVQSINVVINESRQVVYMNRGAIQFSGLDDLEEIWGKRPGEVFGCIHADEGHDGCGTAPGCTYCGALDVAIRCLETDDYSENEAHLFLGPERKAFDFRVFAAPLHVNDERFVLITLTDITDEKWRSFLERIFFHDMSNKLYVLTGLVQLMVNHQDEENIAPDLQRMDKITRQLASEINSHKNLRNAEEGHLDVVSSRFDSAQVLGDIIEEYTGSDLADGKELVLSSNIQNVSFSSDIAIVERVLENMVKNALEATAEGGEVTLSCVKALESGVRFSVHNPGFIPTEIQGQIFKRSFSTKGHGRGLGTYSMNLLSSFVKGHVWFTSSQQEGTTFFAEFVSL
jgi:PAS domain-containing protein